MKELRQGKRLDADMRVFYPVGAVNILREEEIASLWIQPAERSEVGGIEVRRRPCALDGGRRSAAVRQDKVDFMALLVAPVADVPGLESAVQLVQDEVLPSEAGEFVGQDA